MIVYNVTINANDSISNEFITWMKHEHIPDVMATRLFTAYNLYKLITKQPDENGTTYVVQYFAASIEDYNKYQQDYAPALQQKTLQKFGQQVSAFRSLMEGI